MWSARLLARLWAARTGVAVALVIAVLAVLLVSFRVAIGLPPSIEIRRYTVALAGTSLQLDSVPSRVVDGRGDTGNSIKTLSDRAALLGTLLASRPLKQDIARSLNIAPRRIVVTTFTTFPERARLLRNGVPPPAKPSVDAVLIDVKDPRLDEGFSPIIQVQTEARDTRLAVAAIDASVKALSAYAEATANRGAVPPERRVVFRQLEPARYAEEHRGPGLVIALAVGLVVFAGGCVAVLYLCGIVEQMRREPGGRLSRLASSP